LLSLIIPVYRNEESIPDLLEAVGQVSTALPDPMEAVFVVDGSPDRSYELLREALPVCPFGSRLVLLSRNFGAFPAVRAGLALARGDRFAIMAADLQEPPDLILRMDQLLRNDAADVVLGVREERHDPAHSQLPARAFWMLYRHLVVREIPPGGVDVFACNRIFRDQLLKLEEHHSSLVAQLFWLGFRRSYVSYIRAERRHGRSAWTFRKKMDYLTDSVFSVTDLPIRLLVRVGGFFALAFGLFGLLVALARLLGLVEVPGFTALAVLVVFLGAVNLLGLGIVGSYAWRAYENTKQRPLHVVLRQVDFEPDQGAVRPPLAETRQHDGSSEGHGPQGQDVG
jgi:glycosyltransferase involved in cell wall biosynthesis